MSRVSGIVASGRIQIEPGVHARESDGETAWLSPHPRRNPSRRTDPAKLHPLVEGAEHPGITAVDTIGHPNLSHGDSGNSSAATIESPPATCTRCQESACFNRLVLALDVFREERVDPLPRILGCVLIECNRHEGTPDERL